MFKHLHDYSIKFQARVAATTQNALRVVKHSVRFGKTVHKAYRGAQVIRAFDVAGDIKDTLAAAGR